MSPGREAAQAAQTFVDAYLEHDEGARLALVAREGGPHALRRAIDLAALVLAREAEAAQRPDEAGRA